MRKNFVKRTSALALAAFISSRLFIGRRQPDRGSAGHNGPGSCIR